MQKIERRSFFGAMVASAMAFFGLDKFLPAAPLPEEKDDNPWHAFDTCITIGPWELRYSKAHPNNNCVVYFDDWFMHGYGADRASKYTATEAIRYFTELLGVQYNFRALRKFLYEKPTGRFFTELLHVSQDKFDAAYLVTRERVLSSRVFRADPLRQAELAFGDWTTEDVKDDSWMCMDSTWTITPNKPSLREDDPEDIEARWLLPTGSLAQGT